MQTQKIFSKCTNRCEESVNCPRPAFVGLLFGCPSSSLSAKFAPINFIAARLNPALRRPQIQIRNTRARSATVFYWPSISAEAIPLPARLLAHTGSYLCTSSANASICCPVSSPRVYWFLLLRLFVQPCAVSFFRPPAQSLHLPSTKTK